MNEKIIWDFLFNKLKNAYSVAGIMGNLYAESALNPQNLQGSYEKKLGFTDIGYTNAVDTNTYTNFIHDDAGYGLAQWTYWSEKENLYNFAKSKNVSIGDLNMQLEFLCKDLEKEYPAIFKILLSAKTIAEASDIILTKYERPKDQSDSVKLKRQSYAQKYYDQFAKGSDTMAIDFNKYIMSTSTHYISNSGSDENKQYHDGKAGDQTGHEWELKAWYNRPWTVVLRYPNQKVAQTIAELSIAAALNNKIGYDQYQRTTYWTQLKAANYNPSNITVACEEDCTAGVSANVRAAGYLCGIKALQNVPLCSSRNMRAEFVAAGFKALTASKYLTSTNYLLPGDILLYENHHAAANVTCGSKVRSEWNPGNSAQIIVPTEEKTDISKTGKYISIIGDSVNVRKGPGTEYGSLGVVKKNAKLPYWNLQFENGWYLVEYSNQLAAISNKYATVEN